MASATVARRTDLGELIKGPSALAGDFRRTLTLTTAIAKNDFKLRFFGSVLGYLWQLMRPLMLGVLYLMFAVIFKVSTEPSFGVALLLGIVLYTFFAEATAGAVTCVMDRENLVRKIHFPRLVIPMAVVLVATFNLGLNLIVVFIFALANGIAPSLSWLGLIPLLLPLIVFAAGLAMLLAALYVRYRDVEPIWDVVLQLADPRALRGRPPRERARRQRARRQPPGCDPAGGSSPRCRSELRERRHRARQPHAAARSAGARHGDVRAWAVGVQPGGAADRGVALTAANLRY